MVVTRFEQPEGVGTDRSLYGSVLSVRRGRHGTYDADDNVLSPDSGVSERGRLLGKSTTLGPLGAHVRDVLRERREEEDSESRSANMLATSF